VEINLTWSIFKGQHSVDDAENYLKRLELKIIEVEDFKTARLLEQILIYLLNPDTMIIARRMPKLPFNS